MRVAIIGGTGKLGRALSARLVQAGHEVAIGSRDPAKAEAAAGQVGGTIVGKTNAGAAEWCELAILTIPYEDRLRLLEPLRERLQNKIIVDTTVPLDRTNPLQVKTDSGASAAEETAAAVSGAEVFAAFHTVSHRVLHQTGGSIDVLVAGRPGCKAVVLDLIRSMGLRPVDAGPLQAAQLLERLTCLMISINKQNRVKESGIRITGLPDAPDAPSISPQRPDGARVG